ncbi:NAD(P)-dependent dehydrogenase, short-chain alcohol dehydrogenase family [Noviherbaspirillum humi]|uniref:NAD(P)-dependent dehydrogenase, short-chain alcohol dehydrogenase family n=1 Tax=Noviherbaspirillum humi TaxID=1688639 RepID=A0A239BS09_9BURK|nr:SDR family oxidoreductase [Noviherbaspirillum humi]SNS09933.1 NAD(P)-dependent dehydrogenase, short-chain alcohol dehydrogenase family [Noviherbaspirillum humi]
MTADIRKTALVTGAARRIGRSIALALARDGWDVVVHYRGSADEAQATAQEIRSLGRRAAAVACDLADAAAAARLPAQAAQAIGAARLDCIVNNASLFEHDDPAHFSPGLLDAHMRANLAAPLVLAQQLHAATPDGAQAVVINLLDQKLYNPNPDFLSYTLSKAALQSATVLLAQALAPKLRVVGVAPGITLVSGDQTEDGFVKAHAMTPLGRSSTPQDVAETVCFAARNPALTGTTILVDGGQHLMPLQRDVMFIAK